MKFLGLWMLCLVIGKDRVLGNAGQCQGQGKCNKPQILNGKASLLPVIETTPASYGNYDYSYDYTHGAAGDGDGPSTYNAGTEMSVTCVDSYWFKGDNKSVGSIRCCDGRWDPGVNEACVAAKCDPTPQFGGALKPSSSCSADGANLTTAVAANSSACLHCLHRFKIRNREGLKDSIEVQCGSDGKWKIPAHCENQMACTRPAPSERSNTYSRIKNSNFDAMRQMEFVCTSSDFIMYGSPVVRCLAGKWDVDPLPVCRHKSSCLLAIEHGRITTSPGSARTHGPWARNRDSGTVTCDQGHDSITDDDTLTCNWGKWEPAPHCVEPGLIGKCVTPSLRNGNVILSHKKTIPGTVATHTCASGYTLQGAVNRTCLRDGGWNGKEATCVLQATCDKPQTITHAWDPPDKAYYHNEKYRYICRSGFERRGASHYQCDAYSNRWEPLGFDSRRMRCEPVNCGKPSDIPNADEHLVDGRRTTFGAEVRYQCKTGYEKTRGILMSRICQANGRWTVIGLQCDIVTCPPLTNPSNGKVEIRRGRSNRYEYQSEYKFTCDSSNGYRLKGKQIDDTTLTTCTQYGNWSNPPSKIECELVDCYHPGHIFNGYLQAGNTTYPSQRQFGCNDFTTMEPVFDTGRAFIICQRDGRWSESLPKCWGKCRVPNVANGYYRTTWGGSFYSNALEHRNEVKLHCSGGYTTDIRYPGSSTKTLKCDNGTLTQGSCTEKPCDKLSERDENLSNVIYSTDVVDTRTSKYYTHGTTADITCRDTHETANRGSTLRLTCNKRRWNKRTPICKPKGCRVPSHADSRYVIHPNSFDRYFNHEVLVNVTCEDGFVLDSTKTNAGRTTKCDFGTWTYPGAFGDRCIEAPCKLSKWEKDGMEVTTSNPTFSINAKEHVAHGNTIDVSCKNTHDLSEWRYDSYFAGYHWQRTSAKSVRCEKGKWNPREAAVTCQAKGCTCPVETDTQSFVCNSKVPHGRTVEVKCKAGFEFASTGVVGNPSIKCQFGNFTEPLSCRNASCIITNRPTSNGGFIDRTIGSTILHGDSATFQCHKNYVFDMGEGKTAVNTTSKCIKGGFQPKATCKKVTGHCNFPNVANGSWRVVSPFKSIFIECHPGFLLAGGDTIVDCGTDGNWKNGRYDERFQCKACSNVEMLKKDDGVPSPSETVSRRARGGYVKGLDTCKRMCLETAACSSVRYDASSQICTTSPGRMGTSSADVTTYSKVCACPTISADDNVEVSSDERTIGSSMTLKCKQKDEVFPSTGLSSLTLHCRENGTWDYSAAVLKCETNKVEQFSCDFEDGLCNWSLDQSGNFSWTWTSESTASSPTGPNSDQSKGISGGGSYMYVETTRRTQREKVFLLSPKTTESGSRCLRFYYHMSGRSPGQLRVIYKTEHRGIFGTYPQWQQRDGFGDNWWLATVDVAFDDRGEQIGFEGMVESRLSPDGRIAIDDITLTKGKCPRKACPAIVQRSGIRVTGGNGPDEEVMLKCSNGQKQLNITCQRYGNWSLSPTLFDCGDQSAVTATTKATMTGIGAAAMVPTEAAPTTTETAATAALTLAERFRCDFDRDMCNWTHDPSGGYNWTRHQGDTPTGWTGPSSDHTTGNGHYMYMLSSRPRGTKMRLKSPELGSRGPKCFEFYYNKYSYDTRTNRASTLKLYVGSATSLVFSDSGIYNRSTWIHKRIDVAGYPEEKIIIEGVVGLSRYGDIAIDDVSLSEGKCTTASPASVCRDRFISECPGWKILCQSNDAVKRDCNKTCGLCT